MDFNKIIGHQRVIDNLKKAIEQDQISHSYLFEGEESIGKKLVALAFSKTLLCKEEGGDPCNKCTSCLKFDTFSHPDFLMIEPEKGLIKVEKIYDLIKDLNIAPLESKRKVIIIDDSHRMRMESQNALLKTLEEPPSYINIILISSQANSLIPTILSRCQLVKFYPVVREDIEELLMTRYDKSLEEARFISHFTKGSVGRAISLSNSQEFFQKREELIGIIDSIIKGNSHRIFSSMDFFLDNKDNYEDILDIILYWFRDLIIYKELGESRLIVNMDKIPLLSSHSFLSLSHINDIIESIVGTKENIERNVNYQLAMETMLLSIQEV
ncbi:MAG: DNA polymerase III subunit delta' [Tissierellia bacterium]|nr:DNA polymerase III subunit delta' [Tissierellia bacterium]